MKVKVKIFASLRESVGISETEIELKRGQTPLDVWRLLVTDRDLPEDVLTAVNHNYVNCDTVLQNGDEVAFFPPVTGG